MTDEDSVRRVRDRAVRAAKWVLLARVSQVLGISATLVVLPFWLTPGDFGVITIITSILALAMILQRPGLMEATIQSDRNPEAVRDAAFWLSLLVAGVVYLVVFVAAPGIASFLGAASLALPLRLAAVQILLAGGTNVLLAWMERQFLYRPFSVVQLVGSVATILVAVGLAIAGFRYWSYIAGILIGAAIRLILSIRYSKWRPRLTIDMRWFRFVFSFGSFVLAELVLAWLLVWFDNIAVARNLGPAAAGVYSLAFSIATLSISLPCSAISGISLAAFSRMQGDPAGLRATFLRGVELISAYAVPAGIGLALVGPAMLGFAYPDTWKSLGSILSVLGLYAGFGHLWILNTDAFKAIGRPDIMARIYAPVAAVMLPIYWWSSQLGLLEFTIARSSVILVGLLPHTYYAVRYLGLRKDYLWGILRAPLLASLPMAICVWIGVTAFRELLASGGPEVPLLLLGLIALGAGVYWATLRRLSPDFASRAQGLLKRSMSAGSARDPENA